MESDKLIRLHKQEAPSLSLKEREHKTLADMVSDYLAKGGAIKQIETGLSGKEFVLKRSKKEMRAFVQNHNRGRQND